MNHQEYDDKLEANAAFAIDESVEYDPISNLTFLHNKYTGIIWSPLYRDADAFKLVTRLGLSVNVVFNNGYNYPEGVTNGYNYTRVDNSLGDVVTEMHENYDTVEQATRTAITKIAAMTALRKKKLNETSS